MESILWEYFFCLFILITKEGRLFNKERPHCVTLSLMWDRKCTKCILTVDFGVLERDSCNVVVVYACEHIFRALSLLAFWEWNRGWAKAITQMDLNRLNRFDYKLVDRNISRNLISLSNLSHLFDYSPVIVLTLCIMNGQFTYPDRPRWVFNLVEQVLSRPNKCLALIQMIECISSWLEWLCDDCQAVGNKVSL